MQNKPHQGGHTAGYAIVVVMLFTLLTLVIVTMTVASVTSGGRQTTSRGQQGDRALMTASSGLSDFLGQVREKNFRGELGDLDCLVNGGSNCPVRTVSLTHKSTVGGGSATWQWDNVNYDLGTFQISSSGNLGSDASAKAVVTQAYDFYTPSSLNVSAPAALVSCTLINAGGTANLSGNANPTGMIPFTNVVSASPATLNPLGTATPDPAAVWPTTSITVQDASVFKKDSYVEVGGTVFKVLSKVGSTLKLIPPNLNDSSTWPKQNVSMSGTVSVVPMASQGTIYLQSSGNYTIPMNDVSGLQAGDTLYFYISGTRYGLTVVSTSNLDPRNQSVTVKLGATGPGANTYDTKTGDLLSTNTVLAPTAAQMTALPWGTPFARYIMGATSGGSIQGYGATDGIVPSTAWKGSSTVTPAAIAKRSTLQCGDGLFKQTFNMTKNDYLALDPVMLTDISKPLAPDIYWLGPKTYPNNTTYTLNNNALCGGGILIINGSVNMKGTGSQNGNVCAAQPDANHKTGFTGIIYIMGSLSNQGNSTIHGAVVVEGNTSLGTDLGGTMNIDYDDSAVLKGAGRLTPPVITARPGTWRQK